MRIEVSDIIAEIIEIIEIFKIIEITISYKYESLKVKNRKIGKIDCSIMISYFSVLFTSYNQGITSVSSLHHLIYIFPNQ